MIPVILALITASHVATADCLSEFGHHQPPADPVWAPPVDDLPYGHFEWGTDAKRDDFRRWWRLNVIKNGGPPLVIDWKKAGITRSALAPIQNGKSHCQYDMLSLGPQLIPVLDHDAPIIYSSQRNQSAAVYVANVQAQNSTAGSEERPAVATRVETSYRDSLGTDHSVYVNIFAEGKSSASGIAISVSVEKNPELIIGISALPELLDINQMAAMLGSIQDQGFQVELARLVDFAGADAVKQLFWSENSAAPNDKILFLIGGGPKLFFSYQTTPRFSQRGATLVILDDHRRPISAGRMTLIASSQER